jgi:alkanesulfonate monooxygenase SsuD/methylene tetrahydromethanopterin reductase-like flavin-dependent oxidoreductase (luciferase family)
VKIDLLMELERPRPWDGRTDHDTYREALEQAVLADRMGFGAVWAVEHHFLEEFSHSSAPEVFLAAVAARTSRIRIGHGVVLLPHPFNHPVRVAERVAALDILSDGRVEFGTGRSGPYEQAGFEIPTDESRAMWQESLEIIPKMWTSERFSHQGRYVRIPERPILPKPLQRPHPPIWMACTSRASWELAGRNGIGVLGLTLFVSVEALEEEIASYRAALRDARPVGAFVNDRCAAYTIVHCAATDERARANGGPEAALWYLGYAFQVLARQVEPERHLREAASDDPYRQVAIENPIVRRALAGTLSFEELDAEDMVIVGDPERCIRKLERYRQAGLDRVLCCMQAGRLAHRDVTESIRLFGEHVIPHFAAG